jgi:hypothetical protein
LAWKRGPGLSTQSPETGTFFTPRFGLVWIGFSGVSTPHDLVQTLVSADGLEWADLSDPDIYYPMERPPLDDVAGTMSWRMVDDLLIVSRTLAVGERTIWVGGFEE